MNAAVITNLGELAIVGAVAITLIIVLGLNHRAALRADADAKTKIEAAKADRRTA